MVDVFGKFGDINVGIRVVFVNGVWNEEFDNVWIFLSFFWLWDGCLKYFVLLDVVFFLLENEEV